MCGICGCAGPADSAARVKAMLGRMTHRGPDDEGLWSSPGLALGHRRLAIVDLSPGGHQPMTTADGSLVAVVNGEIYNYPALRAALEEHGARFRSNSDSEVVLHAYRRDGVGSFSELNGMFAYGLWDGAAQKLFLVRDRLGIKPVYYWHDPERSIFCFASEIKALLAAAGQRRWQIDAQGLGQYLTYQNTLHDRTLFSQISMLPPGHYLELQRGSVRIVCYWRPKFGGRPSPASFEDAVERFRKTFSESVGRHLMSDVPVACYLSSGFDSTMVTSEAARSLAERPKAFTGHFDRKGWYDEARGARLVAAHLDVPIREIAITADDFERQFDMVIRALDEPRMGMGAFSQFMVAKATAGERKVILTGHGGDELFSGYPVFKMALFEKRLRESASKLVAELRSLRASELPHLAYFAMQSAASAERRFFLPVLFSFAQQNAALQPGVQEAIAASRSIEPLQAIAGEARSAYERILLTYLKVYLPGLLVVEDKISMAHSLEARTPFLDNEMVELSLAIPDEMKLFDGELKAIVKWAARDVLPRELFAMPKRGFPTPLAAWLRGRLEDWPRQRLCGGDSRLLRIFRPEFLRNAAESYLRSWRRNVRQLDEIATHRMWMLLSLESWLRQSEEVYGVTLELAA